MKKKNPKNAVTFPFPLILYLVINYIYKDYKILVIPGTDNVFTNDNDCVVLALPGKY